MDGIYDDITHNKLAFRGVNVSGKSSFGWLNDKNFNGNSKTVYGLRVGL